MPMPPVRLTPRSSVVGTEKTPGSSAFRVLLLAPASWAGLVELMATVSVGPPLGPTD